eukprot:30864-Pelagococcus_subviridis.AAC.20
MREIESSDATRRRWRRLLIRQRARARGGRRARRRGNENERATRPVEGLGRVGVGPRGRQRPRRRASRPRAATRRGVANVPRARPARGGGHRAADGSATDGPRRAGRAGAVRVREHASADVRHGAPRHHGAR